MSWDKYIVVGDSHGDNVSKDASVGFFKFLKIWKPKYRIHCGDVFDARPLRRGASDEEKRQEILSDFRAGMSFIDEMKPNFITWGNHDSRIFDLANNGVGMMKEYGRELVSEIESKLNKLKCTTLEYHKRTGVLHIGKLRVIHGFSAGANAARESARTYGSVLMGHVHSIQSASIPGLDNRVGRAIGAMCNLDLDYNRATMSSLAHAHGFGYGAINSKSGDYVFHQAEFINGKWLLPTGLIEI
jgi:hypothetical protein